MSALASALGLIGDIVEAAAAIERQGGDAVAELTVARDKLRTRLAERSTVQAQVDARLEELKRRESSVEGRFVEASDPYEPVDVPPEEVTK